MKHFIKKNLFYSIPLIIYVLLVLFVDPYNIILKEKNQKMLELKSQISYRINYPLFKLNEYDKNPTDIILLGDSRVDKLNPEVFEQLTKKKTSNLAYGGGTLAEIIETFWYATSVYDFEDVYIGINFNLYSDNNNMNRVAEAIELKNSIFPYLFNRYTLKSTILILKSLVTNEKINIEKPNLSKAEFWRYQLESSANNFYRDYKYPKEYSVHLQEISNYCNVNNIKLVFFTPPTHTDLQEKVNEFKLKKEELRFKGDLFNLGLYYDFDYPNDLTKNRDNFTDPFHYNDKVANIVVNEITSGKINNARTYNILYK